MERHPADLVSLGAGVALVALGAALLVNRFDLLSQARWVVPLLLIVVALAMLASASWSLPRREDVDGGATELGTPRGAAGP